MTNIQFLIKASNFGTQIATMDSDFNLTLPEGTPNHISSTLKELSLNLKTNDLHVFHVVSEVTLLNTVSVGHNWYKHVAEGLGSIYYNVEESIHIFIKEDFFDNLTPSNPIHTKDYGTIRLQSVLDAKDEYLRLDRVALDIPANIVRDMINQPLDILNIEVYTGRRAILPSQLEAKEGQSKLLCFDGEILSIVTMGIELGQRLKNPIGVNIKSFNKSINNTSLLELITDTILNNYSPEGLPSGFTQTLFD